MRSTTVIALCSLVVLGYLSIGYFDTSLEDVTSFGQRELLGLQDTSRKSPRYTVMNRHQISGRFCAMDENDKCHWMDYAQGVGYIVLPAFAMIPISILAGIIFCCGRCCCNCFGGNERTPGNFCFGKSCCGKTCWEDPRGKLADEDEEYYDDEEDEDERSGCCNNTKKKKIPFIGYNPFSVYAVAASIVLIFIGLCILIFFGYSGNIKYGKGVDQMISVPNKFVEDIFGEVVSISQQLEALPYTAEAGVRTQGIQDTLNETKSLINEYSGYIHKYNGYRTTGVHVTLCFAPLVVLIGIIGGFTNKWKITFCAAMFCFLISALVWFLFCLHYPFAVVTNDACLELDPFIDGITSNKTKQDSSTELVGSILSCKDGSSPLIDEVRGYVTDARDLVWSEACGKLADLCNNEVMNQTCMDNGLPEYCGPDNNTFVRVKNLTIIDFRMGCVIPTGPSSYEYVCDPNQITLVCNGQQEAPCIISNTTVANCSQHCENADLRKTCNETVTALSYIEQYDTIIEHQILPLLSCDKIKGLINGVEDAICTKFGSGNDELATVYFVQAIFLIVCTILLIIAAKRWRRDSINKNKEANHYNNEEKWGGEYKHSEMVEMEKTPKGTTPMTSAPGTPMIGLYGHESPYRDGSRTPNIVEIQVEKSSSGENRPSPFTYNIGRLYPVAITPYDATPQKSANNSDSDSSRSRSSSGSSSSQNTETDEEMQNDMEMSQSPPSYTVATQMNIVPIHIEVEEEKVPETPAESESDSESESEKESDKESESEKEETVQVEVTAAPEPEQVPNDEHVKEQEKAIEALDDLLDDFNLDKRPLQQVDEEEVKEATEPLSESESSSSGSSSSDSSDSDSD